MTDENLTDFFRNTTEDPFKDPSFLGAPSAGVTTAEVPATTNPLSRAEFFTAQIEVIRDELAPYEAQINSLVAQAEAVTIDSPETEKLALSLGLPLDKIFKAIEKRRKELVDEPNGYVKAVNSLAKYYQGKIDKGRLTVKDKLAAWAKFKALEAQRAAEAERKAQAKLQAKLDEEAARLNKEAQERDENAKPIETPQLPDVQPATTPKITRTEEGTATEVKQWAFKVVDPAAVPREYLTVDEKIIRKAVKDGIRVIPGVEIFEDTSIRFGS